MLESDKIDFIESMVMLLLPLRSTLDNYAGYFDKLTTLQVQVLNILRRKGKMNMSSLAKYLNYTNQRLTVPVNNLVKLGYIHRIYDDTNRRIVIIDLTVAGRQYLADKRIIGGNYAMACINNALNEEQQEKLYGHIKSSLELLDKVTDLTIDE